MATAHKKSLTECGDTESCEKWILGLDVGVYVMQCGVWVTLYSTNMQGRCGVITTLIHRNLSNETPSKLLDRPILISETEPKSRKSCKAVTIRSLKLVILQS